MQYLLTGIKSHPDKGFGIIADSYYASAVHLMDNHYDHYDSTQQAEMPQNFLFRHAIELYLKSLIIIFHKTLQINYGTVAFDSDEPEVLVNSSWRKLYNTHYIDVLYNYWLNNLLLPNIGKLKEIAPRGDWREEKDMAPMLSVISKYDQDSSYFRYPITKNSLLDSEKFTVQQFKAKDIEGMIGELKELQTETGGGTLSMLIFDEEDNVVEAYKYNKSILVDLRDALKNVAFYFNCMHVMTRSTLCAGM